MLTVDDYARIRRAYRDGMSLRTIARKFGHSWRKVRQAVDQPEPRPYTRKEPPEAPKLGKFKPRIEEILKDDEHQPRKQRHTAMQIFRCLAKEGYLHADFQPSSPRWPNRNGSASRSGSRRASTGPGRKGRTSAAPGCLAPPSTRSGGSQPRASANARSPGVFATLTGKAGGGESAGAASAGFSTALGARRTAESGPVVRGTATDALAPVLHCRCVPRC